MAFFDKLNKVAKNIGDKTSDAIETTKLNSKMNAEKAAAEAELLKVGAFYYGRFLETGEAEPEIVEFCQTAKEHYDRAAGAKAEISRLKAENTNVAGSPGEAGRAEAKTGGVACSSCGMVNPNGTKFCQNCGTVLQAQVTPEERHCTNCGAVVLPGVKFCANCGQKMEE